MIKKGNKGKVGGVSKIYITDLEITGCMPQEVFDRLKNAKEIPMPSASELDKGATYEQKITMTFGGKKPC